MSKKELEDYAQKEYRKLVELRKTYELIKLEGLRDYFQAQLAKVKKLNEIGAYPNE